MHVFTVMHSDISGLGLALPACPLSMQLHRNLGAESLRAQDMLKVQVRYDASRAKEHSRPHDWADHTLQHTEQT